MNRFINRRNGLDWAFTLIGTVAAVCVIGSIAGSRSRPAESASVPVATQASVAPPLRVAYVPIRSIPVMPAPDAPAAAQSAPAALASADPSAPPLAATRSPQPTDALPPQSAPPDAAQQVDQPDPNEAERESSRESIDAMEADLPAERALDEENRQWNEENVNALLQAAQDEQDAIDVLRNSGNTDEADQRQTQLNAAMVFVGGVDVLGARPTNNEEREQQQIDAANARLDELN